MKRFFMLALAMLNPASTLQPDAFDAPAPASVAEAAKTAPQQDQQQPHQHQHQHQPATATATTTHEHESAPKAAVVYVCPMHPEVTSDKPGECPKCGMALVEKK